MGGESPVVELYDSSGNPLSVQNGVAIPANTPALLFAGSDGTNSRYITIDSSGHPVVVGAGTAGSPSGGVISIQGVASGTVVPISGTVTANIGTTNGLALDATLAKLTISQGTALGTNTQALIGGSVTTSAPTYSTGNINPLSLTTAGALRIDGSGVTQPVSGTVTANAGSGTFNVAGTVTANAGTGNFNNSAIGTVGSAVPSSASLSGYSDGVNTQLARVFDVDSGGGTQYVQGVNLRLSSSGGSVEFGTNTNPIRIDPTGTTTQPVSGTVTANAGTGNFTVVQATASNLLANVGGLGASGAAVSGNPVRIGGSDGTNTRDISTDASGRIIIIGAAANGAAVAGNPVLIAGSDGSNARSIRTATDGTVRIDPTGTTTQPVSGTVTANIGTTNGLALDATLAKLTIAQGASLGSNTQALMGGSVTTAAPTYTTGQISPLSLTTAGALRIDGSGVTQPVSGTVTANIGTTNGLALDTSVNGILLSQGSTTSGQKGPLVQGAVTTAAPTYTTGQTDPLSLTTAGALRIDGSGVTQPVSGTVTSNQGTANSLANAWSIKITDTTNGPAAVKAASTAAAATDPALVVAVSPNNSVAVTQATAANLNATVVQSTAANLRAQTAGEATTATSTGTVAELVGGAVTTSAPTYTTGQMNPLSLDTSGNLRVTGTFTSSGAPDTTATGSLNALNAAVQIALVGQQGAAMQLVAGTLIGTIVPELSVDGGTTWISTYFDDPTNSAVVSSFVFGSNNTAKTQTIIVTGGASHVRVRVSVFTSGTATCNLRASFANDPALTWIGPNNTAAPPAVAVIGGKDASGKLQAPQVDVILGQTVEQMSVASTLTSPGGAPRGVFAYTNAYGSLRTSPESSTVFTDIFDGYLIDPIKWTTNGTVSQSLGSMTINAGTAAGGSSYLQGNLKSTNYGLEFEIWGCTAQFLGPATGTYRFIGLGTVASQMPDDAIGFEYDTTGTLFAVIYAGGTNVFRSSALSPSPGTSFNRYGFHFRSDLTLFYYQTSEYPAASSNFTTPQQQTLAPLCLIKNGGSTLGSNAIINLQGVGVTDTGRNNVQISDPTYPTRKAEVTYDRKLTSRVGWDNLLFFDAIEGSTLNSWLWTNNSLGATITQSSGSIILTGDTTSGHFANLISKVKVPVGPTGNFRGIFRVSWLNFANTFIDFGFGAAAGTSALTSDAAYFKLDVNGNLDGYFYCAGALVSTGNIQGIVTQGNYFDYIIEISNKQVRFAIESNSLRLFDMTLSAPTNQPRNFNATHLPVFVRQVNSGTPALRTTVDVGQIVVTQLDINTAKSWPIQLSSSGRSATIDPTTYGQTAQLASAAAPTAGTPSNGAALYTTLGGEYICNATATSESLLSIFAYSIPSPYTFYLTGMFIPPPIVNNAAVATTGTILQFFCITNCASTNINTGNGQRFTVPGFFSVAVSAAVGTVFNGTSAVWTPQTPIACQPGTVIHVGYKVVLGTATASNRQRGSVYIDGFFE